MRPHTVAGSPSILTVLSKVQESTWPVSARSAYPGGAETRTSASLRGARPGSSAPQPGDVPLDGGQRLGRGLARPELVDEHAHRDGAAPGHEKPGQHRHLALAPEVERSFAVARLERS
nr:hypothetical protein GCM10020093_111360 [Planobispora longispora]